MTRKLKSSLITGALVISLLTYLGLRTAHLFGFAPAGTHAIAELPGLALQTDHLDVGALSLHHSATAFFRLVDFGRGSFTIDAVVPSCGCLKVGNFPAELQPGKSVDIPVTMTSREAVAGKFAKGLLLVVSGDHTANIRLMITGTCVENDGVTLFPAHVTFDRVRPGAELRKTIYATGDSTLISSLPATVKMPVPIGRETVISLTAQGTDHSFGSKAIDFVFTADLTATNGQYRSTIVFSFNDGAAHQVKVPTSVGIEN